MKAQDAVKQVEGVMETLQAVRETLDNNDTLDFDVESELNKLEEISDEISLYVDDLT